MPVNSGVKRFWLVFLLYDTPSLKPDGFSSGGPLLPSAINRLLRVDLVGCPRFAGPPPYADII
jgi:hypothetical protein